ncbi:MAG: lysine-sensitive aspartokinase 3, partial [Bryobacteraceae bacterium]
MIVMKFGGTSVESAAAIERVAGIVRSRLDRHPLVVVSAMGKTTNRLLAAADKAAAGNLADALRDAEELLAWHRREAGALVAAADRPKMEALLDEHFAGLEATFQRIAEAGQVTPPLWDESASYG